MTNGDFDSIQLPANQTAFAKTLAPPVPRPKQQKAASNDSFDETARSLDRG
jgi:hypothetical protein